MWRMFSEMDIILIFQLIDELEFILADTPSDQVTESEVMQMKEVRWVLCEAAI